MRNVPYPGADVVIGNPLPNKEDIDLKRWGMCLAEKDIRECRWGRGWLDSWDSVVVGLGLEGGIKAEC